ncbi:pathogenicity [Fusarium longipes]|uniref:Pathogenicity n=1 Tax=Fusarium longipes TaxID=694270 RepID=A0A395TBV0_9HYPO|nr:pathogenicity [Fusarium longipes]
MKFSIVATALLAQGIAAMPWTAHKANGEEITVRIRVDGASGQGSAAQPGNMLSKTSPGPCLKVCWGEEPKCPDNWEPTKFGEEYPCWTCCHKGNDDL